MHVIARLKRFLLAITRSRMATTAKDRYVLHYLSLIDMERVQKSLDRISTETDDYIKEALFRDAVICYAKPFSRNRNISGTQTIKVKKAFVPKELSASHKEVISLRNNLFAHMDLDHQAPQVSVEEIGGKKKFGAIGVAGYERIFTDHLLAPLRRLASLGHSYLLQELSAIEPDA
jgi:hypothetical protein